LSFFCRAQFGGNIFDLGLQAGIPPLPVLAYIAGNSTFTLTASDFFYAFFERFLIISRLVV
jgi:hypothetical protein